VKKKIRQFICIRYGDYIGGKTAIGNKPGIRAYVWRIGCAIWRSKTKAITDQQVALSLEIIKINLIRAVHESGISQPSAVGVIKSGWG
jgi:hypothetical protein